VNFNCGVVVKVIMKDGDLGEECAAASTRLAHGIRDNVFAFIDGVDWVAVAGQRPQAEQAPEGVPDRDPESVSAWENDTRLFGCESDDQRIQPCGKAAVEGDFRKWFAAIAACQIDVKFETGDIEVVVWNV